MYAGRLEGRPGRKAGEELPDSIGQGAGRKAGTRGRKASWTESATETYRLRSQGRG